MSGSWTSLFTGSVMPKWWSVLARSVATLHAVCRKSVLARLQRQLDAGNLRPTSLSEQVTARIIDEAEICTIDPDELSFVDLNSPQVSERITVLEKVLNILEWAQSRLVRDAVNS
jgi:molybdopterin-guanine dinucleotide biosynthesis protein A